MTVQTNANGDFEVDLVANEGVDFTSSNLDIVGYDRDSKTLLIEFKSSGAVYTYEGVEESTYNLLVTAPSVGRFYTAHIKNAGYDGDRFDEGECIVRRDNPTPRTDNRVFSVGDRVQVNYDKNHDSTQYWDGPGTVTKVHDNGVIIVNLDHLNSTGGFYAPDLTSLAEAQAAAEATAPTTKWLTTDGEDSPFGDGGEASTYGVKWICTNSASVGIPRGIHEPLLTAKSEADALAQFTEQIAATGMILGVEIDYKVEAVTHYFD